MVLEFHGRKVRRFGGYLHEFFEVEGTAKSVDTHKYYSNIFHKFTLQTMTIREKFSIP